MVEAGLNVLALVEERGVRLVNRPDGLLAAHDKPLTAQALARAGIPHPADAGRS
jgi:glutathione synthase/RimK-type ligase-like ATP-grasp enzyme